MIDCLTFIGLELKIIYWSISVVIQMKNILQFLTSQTRKVCWQGYNLTIDSVFSLGEHGKNTYGLCPATFFR